MMTADQAGKAQGREKQAAGQQTPDTRLYRYLPLIVAILLPVLCAVLFLAGKPQAQDISPGWESVGVLFYSLIFFPLASLLIPLLIPLSAVPAWQQHRGCKQLAGILTLSMGITLSATLLCTVSLFLIHSPSFAHALNFFTLATAYCFALLIAFFFLSMLSVNFAYSTVVVFSFLNIGSLFYMNPLIESIRGHESRTQFIDFLLQLNPISALAYGGLDHLEWLHSPLMYRLSVIGSYYSFNPPTLLKSAGMYGLISAAALVLTYGIVTLKHRSAPQDKE